MKRRQTEASAALRAARAVGTGFAAHVARPAFVGLSLCQGGGLIAHSALCLVTSRSESVAVALFLTTFVIFLLHSM